MQIVLTDSVCPVNSSVSVISRMMGVPTLTSGGACLLAFGCERPQPPGAVSDKASKIGDVPYAGLCAARGFGRGAGGEGIRAIVVSGPADRISVFS